MPYCTIKEEDRVWKKLNSWKEKVLSHAANEVLIKSVVQAILSYVMSCFLLPTYILKYLTFMVLQFH